MKIILRYLFIALYAGAVFLVMIQLWVYFGFPYNEGIGIFLYVPWLFVCFTGYLWLGSFFLIMQRVRKTILEEEDWLHPLMHELILSTGIKPLPELLILESPGLNAFALGRKTVVLSSGLLVNLSEQEIKAVLAHEFGHLKNRDTLAGSAFAIAYATPLYLHRFMRIIFGLVKKWCWKKGRLSARLLFIVVMALTIFEYPDLFIMSVILFIFMKVFPYFQMMIMTIWCYFSRIHEFQQDGFAQSLGCGRHLKSALLKMDALNSETLVSRIMQLQGTHLMLYMRIRRLEWLEGLRPTP